MKRYSLSVWDWWFYRCDKQPACRKKLQASCLQLRSLASYRQSGSIPGRNCPCLLNMAVLILVGLAPWSISLAEDGNIVVLEILAVSTNTDVDPALDKGFVNSLKKSGLKYTGYKLSQQHKLKISPGEEKSVSLSESHALQLVASEKDGALQLKLQMQKGGKPVKGFPSLAIAPGLSPTLVGGALKLKAGDMLIAIMQAK